MIAIHERVELVGLHQTTNGRECNIHKGGCGNIVSVGSVCQLEKIMLEFEFEGINCPGFEVFMENSKTLLMEQCVDLGLTTVSKLTKKELIHRLLVHEGADTDVKVSESTITVKTRKEVAVAVVDVKSRCRVGFIGRAFVACKSADAYNGLFCVKIASSLVHIETISKRDLRFFTSTPEMLNKVEMNLTHFCLINCNLGMCFSTH